MPLQFKNIAVGNLQDDVSGNNYAANKAVYILNLNNTLAQIFSDEAGTIPIVQDGVNNVTGSRGVFGFWVEAGDYFVQVGANKYRVSITGADYFNNRIDETIDIIVDSVAGRGAYYVVGSFEAGFTYTDINQVGTFGGTDYYIYTGGLTNLSHPVPAGTNPTLSSDYAQVFYGEIDNVQGLRNELNVRALYLTIAEAQAKTDLSVGQYVSLKDRDLGLFVVATGETPNSKDIIDIGNSKQLKLSLNQRLSLDMIGDANRFVELLSEQNVDFATSAKVFGLPKNSALYLGQVLLWQGAGGDWSTGSNNNLSCGQSSLGNNTTGYSNTTFGYEAGENNTVGFNLSAFGRSAGRSNTEGANNSFFGTVAGTSNTIGSGNNGFGVSALTSCVDGNNNFAGGFKASFSITSASNTTVVGVTANEGGNSNDVCIFGYEAGVIGQGVGSCLFGRGSGINGTGSYNSGFGHQTQFATGNGNGNTSLGAFTLQGVANQSNNTAIGYQALQNVTASGNTAVGANAGIAVTSESNITCLGANSAVTGSNQVQLGDSVTTTYAYGAVQDRSDARDKLDIKDLTDAHIAFFMDVEWKQYRMNYRERYIEVVDGEVIELENDGSRAGSRYHIGAVAQQVEDVMKKHDIDFAGLQHHAVNGGKDVYTIGYQEFIGIQGLIIQKQQKTISEILVRMEDAGI